MHLERRLNHQLPQLWDAAKPAAVRHAGGEAGEGCEGGQHTPILQVPYAAERLQLLHLAHALRQSLVSTVDQLQMPAVEFDSGLVLRLLVRSRVGLERLYCLAPGLRNISIRCMAMQFVLIPITHDL